jgi:hypothetical protein
VALTAAQPYGPYESATVLAFIYIDVQKYLKEMSNQQYAFPSQHVPLTVFIHSFQIKGFTSRVLLRLKSKIRMTISITLAPA